MSWRHFLFLPLLLFKLDNPRLCTDCQPSWDSSYTMRGMLCGPSALPQDLRLIERAVCIVLKFESFEEDLAGWLRQASQKSARKDSTQESSRDMLQASHAQRYSYYFSIPRRISKQLYCGQILLRLTWVHIHL